MSTIRFFFDTLSPYSFLALIILKNYQKEWKFNLILEPFFLGGVMHATGNSRPGAVPAKDKFLRLDIGRTCKMLSINPNPPQTFPFDTRLAQRVLLVLKQRYQSERVFEAALALCSAVWTAGTVISQKEAISKILAGVGLDDLEEVFEIAAKDEFDEELKRITKEAVDAGGFGAPTMLITNEEGKTEFFFGSDRFEHIAAFIGREWKGLSFKPI